MIFYIKSLNISTLLLLLTLLFQLTMTTDMDIFDWNIMTDFVAKFLLYEDCVKLEQLFKIEYTYDKNLIIYTN